MLVPGIGHTDGSLGQVPLHIAGVVFLDRLDASLDLADIFEIVVKPVAVLRAEIFLKPDHIVGNSIQNAPAQPLTRDAFLQRSSRTEEFLKGDSRVEDHRKRRRR